jgi:hypothetical protein
MNETEVRPYGARKVRWYKLRPLPVTCAALLACGAVLFGWYLMGYCEERAYAPVYESKEIGNEIISALRLYYREHGQYPSSLEMLVPKHMPEIKPPTWGERVWTYESDGKSFDLCVLSEGHALFPSLSYSTKVRKWDHNY